MRVFFHGVIRLGAVLILCLALSRAAHAASISVTSPNDSGPGTLRTALTLANTAPGDDTISFTLPGTGPQVIEPTSALPSLGLGTTTIDGTTQTGHAPGAPTVIIRGDKAGTAVPCFAAVGLSLTESDRKLILKGVKIEEFDGDGIKTTKAGIEVRDCIIQNQGGNGLAATGGSDFLLQDSQFSGNDDSGASFLDAESIDILRCFFGLNGNAGISLGDGTKQVRMVANSIGIRNGVAAPNEFAGVSLAGAANVHVGDPDGFATPPPITDSPVAGPPANPFAMGGNVIACNNGSGVAITGGSRKVFIQGNSIGVDADGTTARSNTADGVYIFGANDIVIGGPLPGNGNLISANDQNGILISGMSTVGVNIQGNFIGTDMAGETALGNGQQGVYCFDSANHIIGGVAHGKANLVSGNKQFGVRLGGKHGVNKVIGNYLGVDRTGMKKLGNLLSGITLTSPGNTIGGTLPGSGNVISANGHSGAEIAFPAATDNTVQGNFIGTSFTGSGDLGNAIDGVSINGAPGNQIGGDATGAGNVIGFNTFHGIEVFGAVSGTTVQGNFIGVNRDGEDIGNSEVGVVFGANTTSGAPSNNVVGGTSPDQGNQIAFNKTGIAIYGAGGASDAIGIKFRGNSIFLNDGLGINLFGGSEDGVGVTANDSGDGDTGVNGLQNAPALASAKANPSALKITGVLNSRPNADYTLDFYSGPEGDPSGFGEGKRWRGSLKVSTDAGGNAPFLANLPVAVPGGQVITATATNVDGSTSEFSNCVTAKKTFKVSGRVVRFDTSGHAIGIGGVALVDLGTTKATTDSSGFYTIPDAEPGTISFRAEKEGITFYPPVRSITIADSDVGNIKFKTFAIFGKIKNPAGKPLEDISVALSGPGQGTATTDAEGNYIFKNLGAGGYTITPSGGVFNPKHDTLTLPADGFTGAPNGKANFIRDAKTEVAPSAPGS